MGASMDQAPEPMAPDDADEREELAAAIDELMSQPVAHTAEFKLGVFR